MKLERGVPAIAKGDNPIVGGKLEANEKQNADDHGGSYPAIKRATSYPHNYRPYLHHSIAVSLPLKRPSDDRHS
jgi:hypothetical protein